MKKDIKDSKDIELMIDSFYNRLTNDLVLGPFFKDIDFQKHLPVMYQFWENILFISGSYNGNPMEIHRRIHERLHFKTQDFAIWLDHFTQTVDDLFEGEMAELAKQRATSISVVMQLKLL